MYKVITHTIKEEHFTHPRTVEHALWMKDGNVSPMTNAIQSEPDYGTPKAILFRGNVRTLLEKYLYTLRSAVVSILGSSEDLDVVTGEIKKAIADIEFGLKPYYDSTAIALFGQRLTEYTNDLLEIAKLQKDGKSSTDVETRLAQRISDISDFLPSINPKWTKGDVFNYFTWFSSAIKGQITARKAKNWAEDQVQVDNAYQAFITGVPDVAIPFAQYLARGIIAQYPGQFRY